MSHPEDSLSQSFHERILAAAEKTEKLPHVDLAVVSEAANQIYAERNGHKRAPSQRMSDPEFAKAVADIREAVEKYTDLDIGAIAGDAYKRSLGKQASPRRSIWQRLKA
jgi:hypothetical protein